jgi:5'-3' exonuclease
MGNSKELFEYLLNTKQLDFYKKRVSISSLFLIHNICNIVVDGSNYMHKYGSLYLCIGFIDLNILFNKLGIKLNIVFDGKPPDEKRKVLKNRKQKRNKHKLLVEKYQSDLKHFKDQLTLDTISTIKKEEIKTQMVEVTKTIKKHKKRTFSINKKHIILLKNLFNLLKIPYTHLENYEADLVCSELVKMNVADACLSDDNDLISYNCKCILQNLDIVKGTVDIIKLDEVYSKINLKYEQLLYINILSGTDYSNRIKSINISYIHSLFIQKFDIDEILLLIDNPDYNYQTTYNIFTQHITINPDVDIVNYKYRNLLYRNMYSGLELYLTQLNEHVVNTKEQINSSQITKKIKKYMSLFHIDILDKYLLTNTV